MDLRQLNYFVAVAEERNIGRAAERLHLSQPPLTRHIKALEAELGLQLFIRTPRGMVPTQAGETLLKDAHGILGMFGQAAERARRAARGQAGRLDIGLYGSAMFGVVPRVLARFAGAHTGVELALHYAQTPAQVQALRQGRVLLVFERLLPNEPDIEIELVAQEPLLLALSERHALAKRKVVDVRALRDETLIIGTSPTAAAAAVELCRRNGFEPRFASPASDVIMATLLASIGSGVALVPASIENVHFPGIAYRPLKAGTQSFMDVHCFYLRGERSPLLQAMLETVRAFRPASLARRTARNGS